MDLFTPTSEDDAHLIQDRYDMRTVHLTRFLRQGMRPSPTEARWRSLGWQVVSIDERAFT